MELANLAIVDTPKELRAHRQRFRSAYESVIERNSQFWRYYSQHPATLYGERVHAHLYSDALPEDEFVGYIEKLDEQDTSDNALWYLVFFERGRLVQELVGSKTDELRSQCGYHLHHASKLYIAHECPALIRGHESKCQSIDPIEGAPLSDYELKRTFRVSPKVAAIAGLVCLVLGGVTLFSLPESTSPVPQVISRLDSTEINYTQGYQHKSRPMDALLSSRNLLIEASMIPKGINARRAVLDGRTLALLSDGQATSPNEWAVWQQATPRLADAYDAEQSKFIFELPSVSPWSAYAVQGYRDTLTKALHRLGASVTQSGSVAFSGITMDTLDITYTGELIGIGVMAELLDQPFIAVNQLEMHIDPQYNITKFSLSVDVQGDTQ
ncbi:hypothetical protein [Vibrio sp. WXL103]|uniref:hypothetical protein n=1 Tax=unclassified Vibrio TaxID=2614977 RepID=UPI003EC61A83